VTLRTWRLVAGFAGAGLLALDALAHVTVGWLSVRDSVTALHAAPELITRLALGWHFGGALLAGCAGTAFQALVQVARGRVVSAVPVRVVAATCVGFAFIAAAPIGPEPTLLLAFVPGLLLFAAPTH
jgi:hypothetical protein